MLNQNSLASLLGLLISTALLSACSGKPVARDYETFSSVNSDVHSSARYSQRKQHDSSYASAQAALDSVNSRLESADCFRITSVTSQWGFYEPEMLFLGESAFAADAKALIFVPPLLAGKKNFPSPKEAPGLGLYRIDRDAPPGAAMIRQLELIAGKQDYCVKLVRLEAAPSSDEDYEVVLASVMLTAKAQPPKKPEPPKAPEAVKPVEPAKVEESKPEEKKHEEKKPEEKKADE